MRKRATRAALATCGALLALALPAGGPASAAATGPPPPAQPAVARGDPALAHSPQMLQMMGRGGRGAAGGAQAPNAPNDPAHAQGIDIASFQHPSGAAIDWGQVAGAGYKFVYIKATEGNYYQNPYYLGDAVGAAAGAMFHGSYHFANPSASDGVTQADYALNSSGYVNDGLSLPPMVDLEWDPYGQDACYGLNAQQIVGWIAAYSGEVQRRVGRPPVIYTAAAWWTQCTGGTSAFNANPLDIASWGASRPQTPGWTAWTFWQTTSTAAVPGISGSNVDADMFNGTVDALGRFARGLPGNV